jgi:hypothetical protein
VRACYEGRVRWALVALLLLVGCDERTTHTRPTPETPPADALEARLRARGRVVADWMERSGRADRGELREGEARDFTHIMQMGFCYKVIALGGEGIQDLDIRLFDQNNVLLLRDTTEDAQPVIGTERPVCPYETATTYRLEVRARRGSGPFVAQFYHSL